MSTKAVVHAIDDNATSAPNLSAVMAEQPGRIRKADAVLIALMLVLACALRLAASVEAKDGQWVVWACDAPFLQQLEPIARSGNPLEMNVFWYPPVPAYLAGAGVLAWNAIVGPVDPGIGCRFVTLFFSLATVALTYALGRFWGPRHALIAMALMSVTMIAVVVQLNVQVYSAFFVTLAIYLMLRADQSGSPGFLILTGVALGLAVASKYTPVFFAGVLLAPFLHRRLTDRFAFVPAEPVQERRSPGAMDTIWPLGLSLLIVISALVLWYAIAWQSTVYAILRDIYDASPHANPFDYHRVWIDRMYALALVPIGGLAAVCSTALVVPWVRGTSPWLWSRLFYEQNRFWILPAFAFAVTVTGALIVPAAVNLDDFSRHFVGLLKMHATGDYGMFPAARSAPSYLAAYIPENTGLLIFAAGVIGLIWAVIRRDVRMLTIVASVLPAYVVAEFARVKVNRYVLEFMPVWVLLAATWPAELMGARRRLSRVAGALIVVVVICYSGVYSLAWARWLTTGDVKDDVASWIKASIPAGASLGVTSGLILNGSPELLPDRGSLAGYTLLDYAEDPDYVLLPNGVHAVVEQYLDLGNKGYVYTAADWGVTRPSANDLAVMSRIVREDGYTLVKTFVKRPHAFGIEIRSASLTGRTWMVEHNAAAGIRIYRRVPRVKTATAR